MTREKYRLKMHNKRYSKIFKLGEEIIPIDKANKIEAIFIKIKDKEITASFDVIVSDSIKISIERTLEYKENEVEYKGWFGKMKTKTVPFKHQDYFDEKSDKLLEVYDNHKTANRMLNRYLKENR